MKKIPILFFMFIFSFFELSIYCAENVSNRDFKIESIRLFNNRNYQDAFTTFKRINASNCENFDYYYNGALISYYAGDMSHCYYYLINALEFNPYDKNIESFLNEISKKHDSISQDSIQSMISEKRIIGFVPILVLFYLTLFFNIVLIIVFLLVIFKRVTFKKVSVLFSILLFLLIIFLLLFSIRYYSITLKKGIVTEKIDVLLIPSDYQSKISTLESLSTVIIKDQHDEYYKILTDSGDTGWVLKSKVISNHN